VRQFVHCRVQGLPQARLTSRRPHMDELERKIVAHEMALIETVAHIDADHIREGMRAIRAGLVVGITEEERVIRIAAIEMLEAALLRFGSPAATLFGDLSLAQQLADRIAERGENI
jgi:hypothetical protein